MPAFSVILTIGIILVVLYHLPMLRSKMTIASVKEAKRTAEDKIRAGEILSRKEIREYNRALKWLESFKQKGGTDGPV